jgi:hypothetical protein
MHYERSQGFVSWELDTMGPGTVALRVPTWQDVIQIDYIEKDDEWGRIFASKRGLEDSVEVWRVDGKPMQVEVVVPTYDQKTNKRVQTERLPVFEEPVTEVEFRKVRMEDGRRMWVTLGEGVRVTDTERVKLLAEVVGKWACVRQGRSVPDRALPIW